jgi:hypothetical protein
MSTIDPVAALFADLGLPVAPRQVFAEELLSRFLDEAVASPQVGVRRERRAWIAWLFPSLPPRLRVAVGAIVVALALAGIAAAAYLGVRLVYETPPTTLGSGGEDGWASFALAAAGDELYAIRVPRARMAGAGLGEPAAGASSPGTPQLVRIDDIDRSGELQPQLAVDLDLGALAGQGFSVQTGSVGPDKLAVAANGDVFLAVAGAATLQDALFVFHPDRSRQLILDGRELIEANLFPPGAGVSFAVAASATDRVWLLAERAEGDSPQRLFELVDPNADGGWSDRVVRAIVLPESLPFAKRWQRTSWNSFPDWSWQLAAEPWLPGDDRSHSVLAAALNHQTGEFRIYRIGDLNEDGDALDPGEVSLLFDRPQGVPGQYPLDRNGVPPQIAPLVLSEGGTAHREIAVAGLTSPDRVALIADTGAASQVGPAFPNSTDWPANGLSIVAGAHGQLYSIVATRSQRGLTWTIYRLEP